MKNINIRILNQNGDETLQQDIEAALTTVFNAHFKQKQWAYVGTRVFQFEASSPTDPAIINDAARLRQMLEESPEGITVTLAGDLAGGVDVETRKVTVRTLNQNGDETFIEDTAAAVARVVAAHIKNKQWVYVNTNVFQFDEEALNDPVQFVNETARLREYVDSVDGPVTITLAGDLAGGR